MVYVYEHKYMYIDKYIFNILHVGLVVPIWRDLVNLYLSMTRMELSKELLIQCFFVAVSFRLKNCRSRVFAAA